MNKTKKANETLEELANVYLTAGRADLLRKYSALHFEERICLMEYMRCNQPSTLIQAIIYHAKNLAK